MNRLARLQGIFRDVFEDPGLRIGEELSIENYADWDSVAMVQIVLAAESEFGVRFTTDEVASLRSVADIIRVLGNHGADEQ